MSTRIPYLGLVVPVALVVLLIGPACGRRAIPQTDGSVPDQGQQQVDSAGSPAPDAVKPSDTCVLPAGYCRVGESTCPAGQVCTGCYACKGKAYWSCGCPEIVPCSVCSSCIGKCQPKPTICATNADCSPGDFCERDGHCVVTGAAAGQCKPRPAQKSCPLYAKCPDVCGCDGKTYCDACYAHAAGVSVATKSACLATSCAGLETVYAAEIKKAKQCCPICAALQCTAKVPGKLHCSCDTMVNVKTPGLTSVRDEWLARGCQYGVPPCGIKCKSPEPASCQGGPGTTSGTCVDGS